MIYDPATGNANGTGRQQIQCNGVLNVICPDRIDPIALKLIQLIPAPNLVVPGVANNYFASGTYEFNRDNFDFKVNYNPTVFPSAWAKTSSLSTPTRFACPRGASTLVTSGRSIAS